MNALQSLIPSWLHRDEEYAVMPDDRPQPTIATLPPPEPEPQTDLSDSEIFGRAAVLHAQLTRQLARADEQNQALQVQLTEALLGNQGDTKKVQFLELENAELRNTIATLQSDVDNYRGFMSKFKQILDTWGIQPPPKKERKPRKKKVANEQ